jgi:mannose-6-phosphate isomerase-like protein (cupin superfamily)
LSPEQPAGGYAVTSVEALDRVDLGHSIWRSVRRPLGITALGVNAYSADKAGDGVIEPHDERSFGAGGHEELYVVMEGAARFTIDGETVDAPAGTLIRVDVGVHREAVATADATVVLVLGAEPGAAMPVSPFEYWYAAEEPYRRGDYEAAIAIASDGLADHADNPSLNYQLACYHALAGHSDQALDHLEVAVRGNRETATWAAADEDLDAIREDPRFPSL